MRVQEISGKDVHNMKARSLSLTLLPHQNTSKLSRSVQANPGFEGQGGPGVQCCLGIRENQKKLQGGPGSSRAVWGGPGGVSREPELYG